MSAPTLPALACSVYVNGTLLADDVASYAAGSPTVLDGLSLTWGRGSIVDQPSPSTVTFTVAERPGGPGLAEALQVGFETRVFAGGIPATEPGQPLETQLDGSFETTPLADRAQTNPAGYVAAMVYFGAGRTGVRSLALAPRYPGGNVSLLIPPAPFGAFTAWDQILSVAPGDEWDISIWYRPRYVGGRSVLATFTPAIFRSAGSAATDVQLLVAPAPEPYVGPDWQQWTMHLTIGSTVMPGWLGLAVTPPARLRWAAGTPTIPSTETWTTLPPTLAWRDIDRVDLDDLVITGTGRAATLVFAGRITDVAISAGFGTAAQANVTAADLTADMGNDMIGDQPWPAQQIQARIARIQQLASLAFEADIDPQAQSLQVTWQDVDNQPVMGLLTDLATSADVVLWSAYHLSRGFYLWFEDPMARVSLGSLVFDTTTNLVVIDWHGYRPPGAVLISACDITRDQPSFVSDVSDVITRVDATWQQQTLDDAGQPAPTERWIHVYNPAAEAAHGIRRAGLTTLLTSATDCTTIATRILLRSQDLHWRSDALEWTLRHRRDSITTGDVANALALLDGTARIGRAITLTDLPEWAPDWPATSVYLEGGSYRYQDGFWTLALSVSPSETHGYSAAWNQLSSSWRWADFDPDISWADLWGVAAGAAPAWPQQVPSIVERPIPPERAA